MPQRILVIDDDPSLRLTVTVNLEEEGYTVLEAEDGRAGVDVVEAGESVDLVLSDIRMPRMNGVETFQAIRAMRPEVPVVLMTAFAQEALILEAMAQGVFAIVIKPFDTQLLHRVIATALKAPRVLVVDDDPLMRETLVGGLEACHVYALSAESGSVAAEALSESAVDVAVIDLVMPEQDGLECAERLAQVQPDLNIVLMTGHNAPDMIREASARGLLTILNKPFDVRELVRIVAELRGRPT